MTTGLSCAVREDENIIEATGEHVTSVRRPDAAHQARLKNGTIRPDTDEELRTLKAFVE